MLEIETASEVPVRHPDALEHRSGREGARDRASSVHIGQYNRTDVIWSCGLLLVALCADATGPFRHSSFLPSLSGKRVEALCANLGLGSVVWFNLTF